MTAAKRKTLRGSFVFQTETDSIGNCDRWAPVCEAKLSNLHKNKKLTRKLLVQKLRERGSIARKLRKSHVKLQDLQDKVVKTCKNICPRWKNPQKMKNSQKGLAKFGVLRYNDTIEERGMSTLYGYVKMKRS